MKDYIIERATQLAEYIIERRATVRDAAKVHNISKSTVHKDVTERLRDIDKILYDKVKVVLDVNMAERHIRGGIATQTKYKKQR